MAVNIVTGMTGQMHITSDDDRMRNAATFGTGKYVLNFGSKFAATVQSANLVRIMDGMLINQGTQMGIEPEDYEDVAIENGITGLNRNDIIVMRYIKTEETSIEQAVIEVVSGTSTSGTPQDPVLTSGDILDGGDLVDDMPLYRVKVRGLQIEGLDALFTVWQSDMEKNRDNIATLSSEKADKTTMTTELNKKVNKTDVQSAVNTSTNPVSSAAVNTALALKADKSNAWLLSGGTEIPANANLNNYTTVGNYYCISNDNASSLLNCPVQQAFTMKVIYSRGTLDIRQILTSYYNNQTFSRVLVYGSFGEWIKQPERSEITSINTRIDEIVAGQVHGVLAESVNDMLGAKNLFEITAESQTINGVTFTVDKQAGTVTANGTASATVQFHLNRNIYLHGDFILSGCPSGGSASDSVGYSLQASVDGSWTGHKDYGSGNNFSASSVIDDVIIYFASGTTASNLVFRPMIRPAAYESATFAPYAKSNRELTLDAAVLPENARKNLLEITAESQTVSGVTFTVDKKAGTVTANGTASANVLFKILSNAENYRGYIISGCPSGGSGQTYSIRAYNNKNNAICEDYGEGASLIDGTIPFTENSNIRIVIIKDYTANNLVFKPMLRPAGTSPDFAPYMYSNHEITTMMEGNENKNLLEITAVSQTVNGVTFTVDKKAGTVTANGTASANAVLTLISSNAFSSGSYSLSGCPTNGSSSTYALTASQAGVAQIGSDIGSGAAFDLKANTTYTAQVVIYSGTTVSNLVFKPMIRYANTPPDFVPYRKTNEVLTKEIDERWSLSGGIAIPANADLNNYTAVGNYYCSTNTRAEGLSNCPIKEAFTLKVFYGNGDGYPHQEIKTLTTFDTYVRAYGLRTGIWEPWIKRPSRAEITTINNSISSINTTLGSKANTSDVNSALAGKVNTSDIQSSVNTSGNPVSSNAVNNSVSALNSAIGAKLNSSVWTSFTNYAKPPYVAGLQGIVTQEGRLFIPLEGYKLGLNSGNFTLNSFQTRGYSSHDGLSLTCGNGYGNCLQFDVSSYISNDEKGRTASASVDFGGAPDNWPTA